MGRSRGGLTTKIHARVDAKGRPVRLIITPGQAHDVTCAEALLDGLEARAIVIADKGYDADAFVDLIETQGAQVVNPPRSHRLTQRVYDRHLYKDRNLVERFFCRLKPFRRTATRYEKLSQNFMSMLSLACACIWLA